MAKPNILDRAIAAIAPSRAVRRAQARAQLGVIQNFAGGVFGSGLGGTSGNGTGYGRHGASRTKKSMLGWFTNRGSADTDLTGNQDPLVERSRDLFMGAPLAHGALKTIRTNVVGSGLRLKAAIDFDFLGLTREQSGAIEADIEREFRLWADGTSCDADRRLNFGQIQALALLEALHSGDCFAALPVQKRKGEVYDLRVRLIPGDHVSDPKDGSLKPGTDVLAGIERDASGCVVAAYVSKHHPAVAQLQNEWKRVEFYGSQTGRPQLLHLSQDWERIGQRRGIPILAPVIEQLKQLQRFSDAELTSAVVRSFFTVFVTSTTPQTPMQSAYTGEGGAATAPVDAGDSASYEMGSGSIVATAPGEDIKVADGTKVNTAFDAFVMAICRQIGAALELPYELLIKHFTSSYSASRAALLEAWKMFSMRRSWLVAILVQPIYEQWLAEAVAKGRIRAPGFFTDPAVRAAWCGAEWLGPAQGHLNPLQEVRAAEVAIKNELTTREREAHTNSGMLWVDIHAARTREEAARRRDKTIEKPGEWGMPADGEEGGEA